MSFRPPHPIRVLLVTMLADTGFSSYRQLMVRVQISPAVICTGLLSTRLTTPITISITAMYENLKNEENQERKLNMDCT